MIKKGMTILYKVHNNLYVNVTNRCPCSCTFCLRQTKETMDIEDHTLWLEREPTLSEIIAAFDQFDMTQYNEVVFCGYGEPTERMDVIMEVADYVKKTYGKPIRINTNGLGNLIWEQDITPWFADRIDTVSISLNTPDPAQYLALVRPKFGEQSYQAMLDFAKDVKKYVKNVVMTTVDTTLTKEEEKQCRQICENLGVSYRIRPWED